MKKVSVNKITRFINNIFFANFCNIKMQFLIHENMLDDYFIGQHNVSCILCCYCIEGCVARLKFSLRVFAENFAERERID